MPRHLQYTNILNKDSLQTAVGLKHGIKTLKAQLTADYAAKLITAEQKDKIDETLDSIITLTDYIQTLSYSNNTPKNLTNLSADNLGLHDFNKVTRLRFLIGSHYSQHDDPLWHQGVLRNIYSKVLNHHTTKLSKQCSYHTPPSRIIQIMIGLIIVVAVGVFCYLTFGVGLIPVLAVLGTVGAGLSATGVGLAGIGLTAHAVYSDSKVSKMNKKVKKLKLNTPDVFSTKNRFFLEELPKDSGDDHDQAGTNSTAPSFF